MSRGSRKNPWSHLESRENAQMRWRKFLSMVCQTSLVSLTCFFFLSRGQKTVKKDAGFGRFFTFIFVCGLRYFCTKILDICFNCVSALVYHHFLFLFRACGKNASKTHISSLFERSFFPTDQEINQPNRISPSIHHQTRTRACIRDTYF